MSEFYEAAGAAGANAPVPRGEQAGELRTGQAGNTPGEQERRVLTVVAPEDPEEGRSERLDSILRAALPQESVIFKTAEEAAAFFRGRERSGGFAPVLFALSLGKSGVNLELERLIRRFREEPDLLEGCVGGVISDAESDLYSKAAARRLVFAANLAGCAFPGRALVEGTRTLSNYDVMAMRAGSTLEEAYVSSARTLVRELLEFRGRLCQAEHLLSSADGAEPRAAGGTAGKKILVLHASLRRTSNTLALWGKTAEKLKGSGAEIKELSLQNGTLYDCAGCPYHTCLHYGERGSCFYGGVMADEVYPAVREADALVMLCANYNDALSANLTAFINRLTALFRQVRFYDKALFALVVSGYSGGDLVAEQLIGAMNMNKTFYLPPRFALMVTANNAGTAVRLPGIDGKTAGFARSIIETLDNSADVF